MNKRLALGIGIPVVVIAGLGLGLRALWVHDSAPANQPMGEHKTKYEDAYTAQIIESALELSLESRQAELKADPGPKAPDNATADPGFKPSTYLRDVHSKSHGCVLAKFNVDSGIDPHFALGVFAQPNAEAGLGLPGSPARPSVKRVAGRSHAGPRANQRSYDAVLRFSSGEPGIHSDSTKDAQGFAIKLLDVPGKKLLPGDEDDPAQDFILMNNPVFFIRTLPEYEAFSQALGKNPSFPSSYFFPSLWRPSTWHVREMWLALQTKKPRPASVVTTRYWSASAYYLGPNQFVKYSARPCRQNQPLPPADKDDPDYLRLELANQARRGGACFDFMVQPQVRGADMPVEDTTVRWDETVSPFVPVARIEIPAQDNNTAAMNERCENLEFNPWHALPEHKPAGVMNRVRGALYAAMAAYRRAKNGAATPGR